MDSLRIILIILGVFIIAGIYFWERTRREEADWDARKGDQFDGDPLFDQLEEARARPTPTSLPVEGAGAKGSVKAQPDSQPSASPKGTAQAKRASEAENQVDAALAGLSVSSEADQAPDDLLIIHLRPPEGQLFGGSAIFAFIESQGFSLDDQGIYRFYDSGDLLFSLADRHGNGALDPSLGEAFETDGFVLYTHMPRNPALGRELLSSLLHVAAHLAERTGGELFDDERKRLDEERVGRIADRFGLADDLTD